MKIQFRKLCSAELVNRTIPRCGGYNISQIVVEIDSKACFGVHTGDTRRLYSMKLLMHICCGPCTIYPLKELRTSGHDVVGVFYNPNIHPYQEYQRRRQTLSDYAEKSFLQIIWSEDYSMEEFLRQVAFKEKERCAYCWQDRLKYTALLAQNESYDGFTTTLLYSKHQKHDEIREIGDNLGKQMGIPFYYQDFRVGWDEGIKISKELGMYRQNYCGCIYSEKERFCKC